MVEDVRLRPVLESLLHIPEDTILCWAQIFCPRMGGAL